MLTFKGSRFTWKGFTAEEFLPYLAAVPITRRITQVHMHHTWRPNHEQYALAAARGAKPGYYVESMWRFHTLPAKPAPPPNGNGWQTIGQHYTIDPDGIIWTGRDINLAPCSQFGYNAFAAMFEMVGDFDAGMDTWAGPQRDAAIACLIAILLRVKESGMNVSPTSWKFHRELHKWNEPEPKTCPGTGITREMVQSLIDARWPSVVAAWPKRSTP